MSSLPYRYQQQSHPPSGGGPAHQATTTGGTMAIQRFCLRWNNHQSNLLSVFDQLLHEESFVDVTLAVDGHMLKAHKLVLSACSPYFQSLFVNHPDKHPIVILKDVPYCDMKSLLDFMYRGEVSVDQDRLTPFLRVAETLRIKGLTEVNEEKCDNIANSLTQQGVPGLNRLQPNKRFAGNFNMLGNYLLQPKRKRGRPRRLSGNSNGPEDCDNKESVVQGSPEMLEVKMGMDGFSGNNSDGSGRDGDDESKTKDDDEPVAGTSKEGHRKHNDERNSDILHQQLLTPKVEVTEPYEDSNATPESSRMSTPDSIISNNNNNSTPSTSSSHPPPLPMSAPTNKPPVRRRIRRRAASHSNDPAEQLTEMSVRGLNLFRYASIHEGVYQCTECAKVDVTKTFKNKYSFQRHAFLYHEGQQRKVFPCPVCQKEFSRPDKMKNHMKTVHDCFMPKDVSNDMMFPPSLVQSYFPMVEMNNMNSSPLHAENAGNVNSDDCYPETEENDQNHTNLPCSVTMEVEILPQKQESVIISTAAARSMLMERLEFDEGQEVEIKTEAIEIKTEIDDFEPEPNAGVHFLTDDDNCENYEKKKNELLEYVICEDGTVICKLCGEVLASRTHWYRHKYKLHVNNFVSPTPLFKCNHCNVFFKSRKGYTGHLAARHPDVREEPQEEKMSVETTTADKYSNVLKKRNENRRADWEEQRVKEEKLVADIIDRVRRECEAQGGAGSRRGYSRRTTSVMNVNTAC